ncbi:MAG: outer membrane protein OmpK [Providencia rettgeri]|uniref:nucleoside-specific channel-forming Tsx family protein n=1 Tax=unclassified Providencia TaxID=2633465 RepID=UPI00234BB2BF|nr:outer membrane protein OmpK [Providencia sp. PROV164]
MSKKLFLTLLITSCLSSTINAKDYSDDIHKNDNRWINLNLMYAVDELPGNSNHDYLEIEFGGRSGIMDLYGYIDIFNLTNSKNSDKNGKEKTFIKFNPRFSIDALTGEDLSFGAIQEIYLATMITWSGNSGYTGEHNNPNGINEAFLGIGSDIIFPWFDKVGLNLYGVYDINEKEWNGYQLSTNWFKPFYFFENNSFISYQGYIDYQFGAKEKNIKGVGALTTNRGGAMYNGVYWHADSYSIGYGLKAYSDVYTLKNNGIVGKTTGFAHYFSLAYKF